MKTDKLKLKQEYLFEPLFSLAVGTMLELDWSDVDFDEVFDSPRNYIVIEIRGPLIYFRDLILNTEETRKQSTYVYLFDQITQRTRIETLSQLEFWYHNEALRIIHKP